MTRDEKQQRILHHALALAEFEGWSDATLTKAAVAAGLPPLSAKQLFSGGVMEILRLYSDTLNKQLFDLAPSLQAEHTGMTARITALVKARIMLADEHKEAVRRAAAIYALPWNALKTQRAVWEIADLIWHLAGDTATDHNYYTKRLLLSKVYSSTMLVWLQDESEDYADTWAFLDRRIQDVLKVGGFLGKISARLSKYVETIADHATSPKRYRTKRR
jgi:ubiquinone biosynthesis protein COQ9